MSLERRRLNAPSNAPKTAGRDTGRAILHLSNGMEVRGTLLFPAGEGLYELLNLPAGPFMTVANAVVTSATGTRSYESVVVHKEHIVSAIELVDDVAQTGDDPGVV